MPGLGTGSSPSSCPNRSSSDWPVAHRPGRPAMSRTATRQAWPVRQPTVGPQPTPPGPSTFAVVHVGKQNHVTESG